MVASCRVGGTECSSACLGPDYGGGNEDNGDLLQKVHACTAIFSAPSPAAGHHRPTPPLETPGHFWVSLGQSFVGITSPFFWVLGHTRFCLCPPRVHFPVLCKFWQLYGRVNGNLLQEGLCYTQVCCTQSPCTCGSPPLTHISTGDAHSSVSVSVGSLGPGAYKVV